MTRHRSWARAADHAPFFAGVLSVAIALVPLLPSSAGRGFDLAAFGRLPVLEGGRVKPVDTVARNALLMIRGQQSFRLESTVEGKRTSRSVSADEWLLDVLFRPEVANEEPVFVVDDPDVLGLLGMRQTSNRYVSFEALLPALREVEKQATAAEAKDAKERTRFESAVLNLYERAELYFRLENTIELAGSGGLAVEMGRMGQPGALERNTALAGFADFRPLLPSSSEGEWRSTGQALLGRFSFDAALVDWARLGLGWTVQDPGTFSSAVVSLAQRAASQYPALVRHSEYEWLFNTAEPFYSGMVVYVIALICLFLSWLVAPRLLRRVAFGLVLAGFVVHTCGLMSRILLQGRPPVTNLYSSAVFVGWTAVLVALILEKVYRRGIGTLVAAVSGFATLLVAHHLTGDGDTLEMMRAVLDSNFWLGTHVVTITIGYAGTYLAGLLGIVWVVWRLFGGTDASFSKSLYGMTYGTVCFALFFSFLGTVLGGIWADQSWGRFWGWDPKENGALLIVLWNAIILHARFGGFARERGIMAMTIFGNVITSLSWFGVNMLGVGLHSYGFIDKTFWALAAFCATQLTLVVAAYLPPRFWAAPVISTEPRPGHPSR